ncbi:MAG: tetratricopeptide repeat protein [Anaerolineae bacterium]|nr:tetratricopeptide repeat protein [Anaerolineae bacterium]
MSVSCSVCGTANPDQARFCSHCGAAVGAKPQPTESKCLVCGAANPAGFRYCGQCGTALTGKQSPSAAGVRPAAPPMPSSLAVKMVRAGLRSEGERREVTVLFADVSDFTTLAGNLDPEEVYNLVNRCLELLVEQVYRYEGIVDKFTGDGLMALFGAPLAHENDAERAVLAALGMQNALRTLNVELRRQRRPTIGLRIGLHGGPVIAGKVGSDLRMEYTVIGDTVNLAARLQKAASPGTILISQAVYQPTALLFDYRSLPPIILKGFPGEVSAFEAMGPRSHRGHVRGVPGLRAPLIGRNVELARLEAAVERLVKDGYGQVVIISGEAGIGKSRLLAELWERVGHQVRILHGTCLAHTSNINYFPFIEILKNYLELGTGQTEDVAWERLRARLEALAPDLAGEKLAPLGNLLGLPVPESEREWLQMLNPAQLQSRTFLAVRDLLVAEAKTQPLIVALDDLHWADELTLDLLTFLVDAVQQAPLVLIATSRPLHGDASAKLGPVARAKVPDRYLHVRLEELSAADTETLLKALVVAPDLPAEFRQAMLARAEGNPFYLEEMLRMLIDQGVLHRANGSGWQLKPEADLAALAVPPTLQGLIMARFDRLQEDLRYILQTASVIGYWIPEKLLAAVLDPASEADAWQSQLRELVALDFLRVQRESPEREYIFRHAITQDAVYHSLLHRRREALHQQVAEAIERLYAGRLEEHLDELAQHYLLSPAREKALHYALLAAQHAAKNFANARARQLYEQAEPLLLSLPDVTPERQAAAFSGLGDVLMFLGDHEVARDRYRTALRWLTASSEEWAPEGVAALQRKISHTYLSGEGDQDEGMAWLAAAMETLCSVDTPGARVEQARVYSDWGWVYMQRGQWDTAEEWLQAALNLVRNSQHLEEIASIYNRRSWLAFNRGEWAVAASYAQQSLALREKLGDMQGMAGSYTNIGTLMELQGYWNEAVEYHLQALEIHRRTGDTRGQAIAHLNAGAIYTHKGDLDQAKEHLERGLEIAQRINSPSLIVKAHKNLANLGLWRKEWQGVLAYAEATIPLAETVKSAEDLADILFLNGEAYLGQKELQKAAERGRQALLTTEQLGPRAAARGRALRLLGAASLRQGDVKAATEHLNEAVSLFKTLDSRFELGQTYVEVARVEHARKNDAQALDILLRAWDIFRSLGARLAMDLVDAELKVLSNPSRPSQPGHFESAPART